MKRASAGDTWRHPGQFADNNAGSLLSTTSIWDDDLPSSGRCYPGGELRVHTAVIGGGLTGLSAAFHLLESRPDRQVVVLEAERVGHGGSGRSTGMLTPGVGQNLAALVRRVGKNHARAMYTHSLRAVESVGALTAREGIDCQLRMTGQLVVARGRAGRERLGVHARTLEELDLPHARLDDAALLRTVRLATRPAPGRAAGHPAALRLPVAGLLHPGLLLDGLARSIQRRGGEIYTGARVTDFSRGGPVNVRLTAGSVTADHVVLATDGYTPQLGCLRGRILPLHLQVLLTEPLDAAALEVLGWEGREGIIDSRRLFNYFRLTEDCRILFGGGVPHYFWGGATRHERPPIDRLAREFAMTFPAEVPLRIARSWTGVIGYVRDTLPVIGRLRDCPAVVVAGGWCGHGIALSLASGAWVAHFIHNEAPPEDLPWFRDSAPLVPTEPARWLGVRGVSSAMALMDRI